MPIRFVCEGCSKTLQVPDHAAGLTVDCPECSAKNKVPEPHFQKGVPSFLSPETRFQHEPAPFLPLGGYGARDLEIGGGQEEDRRPCPMCGEMILVNALKCRYCGEIFDEILRRAGGYRGAPLASPLSRLGAAILDGIITGAAMAAGFLILLARPDEFRFAGLGAVILLAGLAAILIIQMVLLSTRGQTLGKMAAGVRIVRYDDGGEVGFGTAVFLRSIVPTLIGLVPGVGGCFRLIDILFIFGEEHRCIHDYIAGTKVVIA